MVMVSTKPRGRHYATCVKHSVSDYVIAYRVDITLVSLVLMLTGIFLTFM